MEENDDEFHEYNRLKQYVKTVESIKKLLSELILIHNFGICIDDDYKVWTESRLKHRIVPALVNNDANEDDDVEKFNAGLVLCVACKGSLALTHIEQIVANVLNMEMLGLGENVDFAAKSNTIVPKNIILFLIQDYPDSVCYFDSMSDVSALHVLVGRYTSIDENDPECISNINNQNTLSIIQLLIGLYPTVIHIMDSRGKRPIDILATMILMKEERLKYSQKSLVGGSAKRELEETWECARLLVIAHCQCPTTATAIVTTSASTMRLVNQEIDDQSENVTLSVEETTIQNSIDNKMPTLHACVLADNIPLSLLENAIIRFADEEISKADSGGNLPLHLVASKSLHSNISNDTNNSINCNNTTIVNCEGIEDDEVKETNLLVLDELLKLYPDAASRQNGNGLIPFDAAVKAGRLWDTGIKKLLKAYPKGLADNMLHRGISMNTFPLLMESFFSLKHEYDDNENALSLKSPYYWIGYAPTMEQLSPEMIAAIFRILMAFPDSM